MGEKYYPCGPSSQPLLYRIRKSWFHLAKDCPDRGRLDNRSFFECAVTEEELTQLDITNPHHEQHDDIISDNGCEDLNGILDTPPTIKSNNKLSFTYFTCILRSIHKPLLDFQTLNTAPKSFLADSLAISCMFAHNAAIDRDLTEMDAVR